jgi:predicted AAA+ superfamily ATPase
LFIRWQHKRVRDALKNRRVVVISGARQIGKTTLVQASAAKQDVFWTLDDTAILETALNDPLGFVRHKKGTMIIDEIQKAPSLLLAIKQVVDADNRTGQFLLTGSADIRTLPTVTDSLAGRISHIRLRGLTIGETLGLKPRFLTRALNQDWPLQIKGYDKAAIIDMAFGGGYPEVLRLKQTKRKEWFEDYTKSLLARDLRDIANIQRQDIIKALLYSLSAWSGKFMELESICSKISTTRKTLVSYVNVLSLLCLFDKVPPWIQTDYERVGRKEKIYSCDTGLMAYLLNWRPNDVSYDPDKCGKMIETFVFNELIAQVDLDYRYSICHYRDRERREIDFIIENDAGELLGVEVKSGSAVSRADARHMEWFKKNIARDRKFIGTVLYAGENILPLGKDMYAVPIAALWN